MNIFITTATKEKAVVFYDESAVHHIVSWSTQGTELAHVLPALYKGLEETKITWKDIASIIVVKGPGSFTGIRVAISIVNMVSYLFPHIEVYTLTTGKMFAVMDKFAHSGYVFQSFLSDYFLFDAQGDFVEKVTSAPSLEYAGERLDDVIYDHIIPTEHWNPTMLTKLEEHAEREGSMLTPFYGKDANITTPKRLP